MMRLVLLLLSLGLLFSIAACDDNPQKKTKVVRPRVVAKKIIAPVVKKEVAKTELPKFRYVVRDRRDPFVSLVVVREPVQDNDEPLTPLQTFGVKELRLNAIVIGKGEPRAMVVAPDKKAYTLSVGIKVGRNQGVVKNITKDEVVVEEVFRDFSGGVRTEVKKITLPHGEGE